MLWETITDEDIAKLPFSWSKDWKKSDFKEFIDVRLLYKVVSPVLLEDFRELPLMLGNTKYVGDDMWLKWRLTIGK